MRRSCYRESWFFRCWIVGKLGRYSIISWSWSKLRFRYFINKRSSCSTSNLAVLTVFVYPWFIRTIEIWTRCNNFIYFKLTWRILEARIAWLKGVTHCDCSKFRNCSNSSFISTDIILKRTWYKFQLFVIDKILIKICFYNFFHELYGVALSIHVFYLQVYRCIALDQDSDDSRSTFSFWLGMYVPETHFYIIKSLLLVAIQRQWEDDSLMALLDCSSKNLERLTSQWTLFAGWNRIQHALW